MDFNYTKIKLGNWMFKNWFSLYNFTYNRFKLKNDRSELELLRKLVKPGFYVLDIGGNIGFYAKTLSKLVGENGKVFSFEPDVTNFKYLKQNTSGLKNIQTFNKAVSDKEEILKIYTSKLLNVDHRTYPVNGYDKVEEISAINIDALIANGTIPKVDFIKIDIQGFELSAFKGMEKLLSTSKDLRIVAEYWPHGFKRAGISAIEFYNYFTRLGFSFTLIDETGLSPVSEAYIIKHNDEPFEFSFNVLIEKN